MFSSSPTNDMRKLRDLLISVRFNRARSRKNNLSFMNFCFILQRGIQTSKMELFGKIVNGLMPLRFFG